MTKLFLRYPFIILFCLILFLSCNSEISDTPSSLATPEITNVSNTGLGGSSSSLDVYDRAGCKGSKEGGSLLCIDGNNFQTGAKVSVESNPAIEVVVRSSSRIDCKSPAGTEGTSLDITVENPDKQIDTYIAGITYVTFGKNWANANASSHWSARYGHTSIVYDNKMWVLGGNIGAYKDDVWYSSNGKDWTNANASSHWSARYCHTSIVYDNKMWVLGGYDRTYKNDVWYSSNGKDWTNANASSHWSARRNYTNIVYDNKMWVLGGDDGAYKNDVWYNND